MVVGLLRYNGKGRVGLDAYSAAGILRRIVVGVRTRSDASLMKIQW